MKAMFKDWSRPTMAEYGVILALITMMALSALQALNVPGLLLDTVAGSGHMLSAPSVDIVRPMAVETLGIAS